MFQRTLILFTLLALLTGACRVIDVRTDPEVTGLHSDALIEGYATLGFADDPSFVRVDVLRGQSPGAVFYFELWYLLRVELGLVGAAVGVGPFDIGIGTLFYHPRSPLARRLRSPPWDLHGPCSADGCEAACAGGDEAGDAGARTDAEIDGDADGRASEGGEAPGDQAAAADGSRRLTPEQAEAARAAAEAELDEALESDSAGP